METFSFFKYFYNRVAEVVGGQLAGSHFVAITDPGSGLVETAERYGFRKTFLNDPQIGGRYSALSHFGVVPAALAGVGVSRLLDSAGTAADECSGPAGEENPGAWLGAVMGELAAKHGRDKLTLFASPTLAPFGPWVEQLIAESTGKDGVGILPVAGEPPGEPEAYGEDRLFVGMSLRGEGDGETEGLLEELRSLGHPTVEIILDDPYDLGAEMFRWEVATAIAGQRLGINPFDQPNVESAKTQARSMIEEYRESGELPAPEPTVREAGVTVYSDGAAKTVQGALTAFLEGVTPGDYVALQAYVQPSDGTTGALQRLRVRLRDRLRLATTVGYGPRFLHSTGQLHKGDAGNGLFVQITADDERDAAIPDEAGEESSSISFGVLKEAQALGDRQALLEAGRRVIRLHLEGDVPDEIDRITEGI